MAKHIFASNASSLLAASISDTDLTIQVQPGYGALFPNPGADEYFYIALQNASGDIEYVKISARSTDLLTVPTGGRGQGGTSAQSWTNGQTRVELRNFHTIMELFLQRGGDSMDGDLDMDGNELQNAVIDTPTITGGQSVGTPMRGVLDDPSNELSVPDDGTRATAGGVRILVETDTAIIRAAAWEVGMVTEWYGLAADCPDGWAICDGNNGTPDLRGFFVRGAATDDQLGDEGGADTASIDISEGGGVAAGTSGETTLTEEQIPEHNHRLLVWESGSSGPGQMENFGNSGLGPARGVAGNADSNTYAYRENTDASIGNTPLIEAAGGGVGAGHSHALPEIPPHDHSVADIATVPRFKYLYKIMFTG